MALTRRGKLLFALGGVVAAAAAAVIVLAVVQHKSPGEIVNNVIGKHNVPKTCPLTGLNPPASVPNRPALAIKVENLPAARPQAGLQKADVTYEEPVEGGITRFIVMYQCQDANRVGPVRSARLTDPDVLSQFGKPIFGFAGAQPKVLQVVDAASLEDVNFNVAPGAYTRDPRRVAPHNLYTTTKDLYGAAKVKTGVPDPVFTYSTTLPKPSKVVHVAHLDFSGTANVFWKWSPARGKWLRSYDTGPSMLEGNVQVSATNVVVMVVKIRYGPLKDVLGNPSPEVTLVGQGPAYVLRNGRMVAGTWKRPLPTDLTKFYTRGGKEIALAPGVTWVELYPVTAPHPSFS